MTRFPRYPVWSRGKSLHGWESCFHKNKRDDPLFDGRITRAWLFPEKELEEVFFLAFPSFDFFLTYEFSPMPRISLPSSSFWYFISRSIFFPVKRSEASSSLSLGNQICDVYYFACREFLNYERTRRFLVLIFFSKGLNLAKIEEEEGKYDLFRN